MLITLTVDNSYSKIINLTVKQQKELSELLSFTVGGKAGYYARNYGPRKKSLLDKRGNFPTGLLHRVKNYLAQINQPYRYSNKRIRPKTTRATSKTTVIPLYEAQKDALKAAAEHHCGTIAMPTGTGKSMVIREVCAMLNVPTIVVVPTVELKKQLGETLKDLKNVTVENIDSKRLQDCSGIDCLIIDEAHHGAAKTYQKLNKTAWKHIYYRYFFTATPFRNDPEEELLLESITGNIIYQLSYKEAIASKLIVPIEAYYIELPKIDNDYYTWAEVYSNLVVKNSARNMAIATLAGRLNAIGKSTLLLVKEVEHGYSLANLTGLEFVNGADTESRAFIKKFNNLDIRALIGTTGVMGEGIDSKPCEYVIIAGLGKAKSQFQQQIGRAVRKFGSKESAKIIIIKDASHRFTLRHFRAQCKILKQEYGVTPQKLEL